LLLEDAKDFVLDFNRELVVWVHEHIPCGADDGMPENENIGWSRLVALKTG
jgi:hypothetical protein